MNIRSECIKVGHLEKRIGMPIECAIELLAELGAGLEEISTRLHLRPEIVALCAERGGLKWRTLIGLPEDRE